MEVGTDSQLSATPIPSASKRMNEMIAYVRQYTRDFPELNRLTQGYESSPRMVAWAIVDALDDWNSTPPFIGGADLRNFPSVSLLARGAALSLIESVTMLQMRNQLNFTDGGISVSVNDKGPMLMQWLSMMRARYDQQKMAMKASINIESAFIGAGNFSELFLVNGNFLSGNFSGLGTR